MTVRDFEFSSLHRRSASVHRRSDTEDRQSDTDNRRSDTDHRLSDPDDRIIDIHRADSDTPRQAESNHCADKQAEIIWL